MVIENKKKLSELGFISSQSADLEVLGLSSDSRTVKKRISLCSFAWFEIPRS
jgi:hypothetical protein